MSKNDNDDDISMRCEENDFFDINNCHEKENLSMD